MQTTNYVGKRGIAKYLWAIVPVTAMLFIKFPFAQAREGFFDRASLPQKLNDAWDATYAVPGEDGWGTVFLVGMIRDAATTRLRFLTAMHVIHFDICKGKTAGEACTPLNFSKSIQYEKGRRFLVHSNTAFSAVPKLVKVSYRNDLALLEVLVPAELARSFKPISLAPNCAWNSTEEIFATGFNNINVRQRVIKKIYDVPQTWSRGIWVSREVSKFWRPDRPHRSSIVSAYKTTVDSIAGGSGQPLTDNRGYLIGLINSGQDWGNHYSGSEDPGKLRFQSSAISCEVIADFLSDHFTEDAY